jgi:hypothetical protein
VPKARPPANYDGTPHRYLLRRGTRLWRVHPQAYGAFEFNARLSDPLWDGARFDATVADKYPCLYAGLSDVTALAETLLRDIASDERGYRVVPNDKALGRRISRLTLTQDLDLVSLIDGRDLGAIGQDDWLVSCPPRDYPQTRDWGHWLRRAAPRTHGLIWDSKRDRGGLALVLFGDRIAGDFGDGYENTLPREVTKAADDLGQGDGLSWANERLRPYRAVISQPLA